MSSLSPTRRALNPFEARMNRFAAHDLYDDGKFNGSVLWKTAYAPTESGNDRLIRDADGVNGKQVLGYAIQGDYYDNGRIDGSFLKNWFGYTYWVSTGHDISPQLNAVPNVAYQPTWENIFAQAPNPFTPEGWGQVAQGMGVSGNGLYALTQWGHDAIEGQGIDGQALVSGLTNPDDQLNYGIAHINPQVTQYAQAIANADVQRFGQVTGDTLNNEFLRALGQVLRVRFI
ncbi:MAG: hypothetical protein KC475_03160 [Cyanobacteria bacterium HKST-UBA03]|nr:hypothetical protein [Cyanobacteria bacterium HKST-UBA03]